MKKSDLGTYALFPAVIFYGILTGAIVYSHIAFLPAFLSDLPNSAVLVTGKYAVNEAPFWMSIHPFLILSLVGALVANLKNKARRKLIAVTLAIYSAVLIVTAVYFVPELLSFAKSAESTLPAADWRARGHRWETLSQIRGAVVFLGLVPLLAALSRPAAELHESAAPKLA